jgi:hypothetical protein
MEGPGRQDPKITLLKFLAHLVPSRPFQYTVIGLPRFTRIGSFVPTISLSTFPEDASILQSPAWGWFLGDAMYEGHFRGVFTG